MKLNRMRVVYDIEYPDGSVDEGIDQRFVQERSTPRSPTRSRLGVIEDDSEVEDDDEPNRIPRPASHSRHQRRPSSPRPTSSVHRSPTRRRPQRYPSDDASDSDAAPRSSGGYVPRGATRSSRWTSDDDSAGEPDDPSQRDSRPMRGHSGGGSRRFDREEQRPPRRPVRHEERDEEHERAPFRESQDLSASARSYAPVVSGSLAGDANVAVPGTPVTSPTFAVRLLDAPTQLSGMVARGRAFVADSILSLLRMCAASHRGMVPEAVLDFICAVDPSMSTERLGSRGYSIAEVRHMIGTALGDGDDSSSPLNASIQVALATLSPPPDVPQPASIAAASVGLPSDAGSVDMRRVCGLMNSLAAHLLEKGPRMFMLARAHFFIAELEAAAAACEGAGVAVASFLTGTLTRKQFLSTMSMRLESKDAPAQISREDAHCLADAYVAGEEGRIDYLAFTRALHAELDGTVPAGSVSMESAQEALLTVCSTLRPYYIGPHLPEGAEAVPSLLAWLAGSYSGDLLHRADTPPETRAAAWLSDMALVFVPQACAGDLLGPGSEWTSTWGTPSSLPASVAGPEPPAQEQAPAPAAGAGLPVGESEDVYEDDLEVHVAQQHMSGAFKVVAALRSAELARIADEAESDPEQLSDTGHEGAFSALKDVLGDSASAGDKEALHAWLLACAAVTSVKQRRALKSVFKDRQGKTPSASRAQACELNGPAFDCFTPPLSPFSLSQDSCCEKWQMCCTGRWPPLAPNSARCTPYSPPPSPPSGRCPGRGMGRMRSCTASSSHCCMRALRYRGPSETIYAT